MHPLRGRHRRQSAAAVRVTAKRLLLLLLLVVGIAAADIISKSWAVDALKGEPPVVLTPFLQLVYVENTGAAFGFLSDQAHGRYILLVTAAVLCTVLVAYAWYCESPHEKTMSALIVGGAIGNIIDRWQLGYVVDFIDAHWGDLHWPVFNIADMAISCGAMGFVYFLMRGRSAPPPPTPEVAEAAETSEASSAVDSEADAEASGEAADIRARP